MPCILLLLLLLLTTVGVGKVLSVVAAEQTQA